MPLMNREKKFRKLAEKILGNPLNGNTNGGSKRKPKKKLEDYDGYLDEENEVISEVNNNRSRRKKTF